MQLTQPAHARGKAHDSGIKNLRIHFYGTQGSVSTFPSHAERRVYQEVTEAELLEQVLTELSRHVDSHGRLKQPLEQIIGGPVCRATVAAYRQRFRPAEPTIYGGWTTCVRVDTSDGYHIVLDCGSGFRRCAEDLQLQWGDSPKRDVHIFGSHSHSDHTEGFEQAALCFDPRNTLHVHGNRQFLRALDSHLGVFSHHVADRERGVHTPLFYGVMPATFVSYEIRDGKQRVSKNGAHALARHFHDLHQPIRLGKTTIKMFELFHTTPCLGFRIEHGGKVFVFCTDHELRHGPDEDDPRQQTSVAAERRLVELSHHADLLYRDGQYLRSEYEGLQPIGQAAAVKRLDWGHSCIEDVVEMAHGCGVKQTLIGHHDPNRGWSDRSHLDEALARSSRPGGGEVHLASSETVWDL